MCGICGAYYFSDGDPREPDPTRVMADALRHRGPDSDGFHAQGRIRLGHRRLSIIDVAHGDQPIANEDGTIWVTFNGEIFNFLELRDWLEGRRHRFRTRCDTEVIVHLYEELGLGFVDRLRGQFAIALWDSPAERLVLARDRLGIKPLYYTIAGGKCLFASEAKGILAALPRPPAIDERAVLDYLTLLYVPTPRTVFQGIRKIEPGHILVLTPSGSRSRQYWDLRFEPSESIGEDRAADQILQVLREAVRIRLISEVPLGAFLSGGIDSSAVVALMAESSRDPVRTFSIGFREARFNELPYARALAERIGAVHMEKLVPARPHEVLDRISALYDEPFADSSAIPTYTVAKITRSQVTVALSGDGGDENFAGYRRYYFDRLENRVRSILPAVARRGVFGAAAGLYPKADWLPRMFRAKTLLGSLAGDGDRGYFLTQSAAPRRLIDSMLAEGLREQLRSYDPFEVFERHFRRAPSDPLARIQYVDFKTYLPDDILTKVDRASMAHSLEVRVPILDHELVELAASLPSSLKLRGRQGKRVFRRALRNIVPDETLDRRKMGFAVPLASWMRDEFRGAFHECLDDPAMAEFFDIARLRGMWQRHARRVRDFATPLYCVLAFHGWYRNFAVAPPRQSRIPIGKVSREP